MPPNKTEQEADATQGHVASTDGLAPGVEAKKPRKVPLELLHECRECGHHVLRFLENLGGQAHYRCTLCKTEQTL
jgi:DNA-directed RNA polymerase subunit RPC12/RpoP